jgi:hypothetical protein
VDMPELETVIQLLHPEASAGKEEGGGDVTLSGGGGAGGASSVLALMHAEAETSEIELVAARLRMGRTLHAEYLWYAPAHAPHAPHAPDASGSTCAADEEGGGGEVTAAQEGGGVAVQQGPKSSVLVQALEEATRLTDEHLRIHLRVQRLQTLEGPLVDLLSERCEFVRSLAYMLLLRAARLSPLAAARFAEKHLECLHSEDPGVRASGTPHFTCFTSTKVQILTPQEQRSGTPATSSSALLPPLPASSSRSSASRAGATRSRPSTSSKPRAQASTSTACRASSVLSACIRFSMPRIRFSMPRIREQVVC